MASQDAVLRLLLVEDRLEDAEQLISHLRNGGMAVRPQRPENAEELQAQVAAGSIDLVMAAFNAAYIPFANVIAAANSSSKDLPVIATLPSLDENLVLAAIAAGARNVALRTRGEHVQFAARNSFGALIARRGLRHLEAALRETERRCDALIATSRDPIAYVHEGMHIRANQAYLEMFGFESFEDIEGLSLLDMVAPKDADEIKQLLKRISKGESPPKQMQIGAQRGDGSTFDAVVEFTPASYEGEACLQIVFRQKTVDAAVVEELDKLRQRDPVTNLFNRTHFMTELETVVARAADGKGQQALLMIEPDSYEGQLGAVGIAKADDLLRGIAARIESALGGDVACARFADHTFAVLARAHDHKASHELADKIREAFHQHIIELGDRSVNMTVSIGGVQIGEKIASVPQVLAKANHCLQSALGVGGNRIDIHDPSAMDRAEQERIDAWIARIKDAIARDEFQLLFQPIISLSGAPGETYEVYLRMKSPSGELVEPETFFEIAEEHGLLDDIDRWVVSRAIAVLSERRHAGHDTTLFVKVTPASVTDGSLEKLIAEQLRAHGISGERLVLQLTESKIYTHLKAVQDFSQAVTAQGCHIAIEQFGTGLNSMQMLSLVNPAILKIDRSFIADLGKSTDNQKKVREFTETARGQGRLTVAEHVSDAGSMTVLFSIGVDYVEGNFLAPPGTQMNYDFSQ